jgi:SAM-dependent methyltransferase
MNIEEYDRLARYEESYWWHIGRNFIVHRQLELVAKRLGRRPLRILNIGCGTGGAVPTLAAFGEVHNVDAEPATLEFLRKRGIHNAKLVTGIALPYDNGAFDVVVAMDVLEHIDAENAALTEWRRVLKQDGEVLITVPAYSWLCSTHDEALHHFRRYSRSHLTTALRLAGFDVTKKSYAIAFSLPLVVGYRILDSLRKKKDKKETSYVDLPGPVNSLFTALLKGEGNLLRHFNLPWGTSVLARARIR